MKYQALRLHFFFVVGLDGGWWGGGGVGWSNFILLTGMEN